MKEIEKIKAIVGALSESTTHTGIALQKIRQAENRLQVKFPPVLVAFYQAVGNHPIFKGRGCYEYDLIPLAELAFDEDDNLMLLVEGGGYESVWESIHRDELTCDYPQSEYWCVDSVLEKRDLGFGLFALTYANVVSRYEQKAFYTLQNTQTRSRMEEKAKSLIPTILTNEMYGNKQLLVEVGEEGIGIRAKSLNELKWIVGELGLEHS